MNWDTIEGNWKQLKGNVKEQWGKLTDDHIDVIAGKRDQLAGKIQEQYGITKDEVEAQIAAFEKRYAASADVTTTKKQFHCRAALALPRHHHEAIADADELPKVF